MCLVYLVGHDLDDPGFGVLFSDTSIPVNWSTQPPIQREPPVLVPEIMQQGSEIFPSPAEEGSYTSTPAIHLRGVQRDNVTFVYKKISYCYELTACVSVSVCVSVSTCVSVSESVSACVSVSTRVSVCVSMPVSVSACVCVYMCVCV